MNIDIGQHGTAAHRRASLLGDLHDLIDDLATMGGEGIPELITIQLPAPGDRGHEGKQAWLDRVAEAWHTEVLPDGMGGRFAEKQFGSVRMVASVARPTRWVFGYTTDAAALAANGMGATA